MTNLATPNAPSNLNGHHRHTYDAIFCHPVVHNLEWHDVRSMLAALAVVTEGHNGAIQVSRNGQLMTLHIPKHKDLATVDDLMSIRHFLEKSAEPATTPPMTAATHLLVVIDHQEAKIYRTELHGAVPQQIVPHEPHGFRRHLHSRANSETSGHREPELKSYYEDVAKCLKGAEQILIFGSGTGASSAMNELVADLKKNHADIAAKVIGSIVVDAHHTTENKLLTRARAFYAEHK